MPWSISGTRRATPWPSAANTGVPAGTTLTPSTGFTASTTGQIIQGLDISGTIFVAAAGVVIKNCRINAGTTNFWCVNVDSGSVTIQDTELMEGTAATVIGDGWTVLRCNVHSVHGDGFKLGNNTNLLDSYVHDFATLNDQHADGAQLQFGLSNVVVRGNSIDVFQSLDDYGNSAIFLKNDLGPAGAGPVTVDNNLIGGGGFTLYAVTGSSGDAQNGITVTNNRFKSDFQFGTHSVDIPVTWSGNTWADGPDAGQVITL